jgi:hypothetical protein
MMLVRSGLRWGSDSAHHQIHSSDFSLAFPVPNAVDWALSTITLELFGFGLNYVKHSSGYILNFDPKLELML